MIFLFFLFFCLRLSSGCLFFRGGFILFSCCYTLTWNIIGFVQSNSMWYKLKLWKIVQPTTNGKAFLNGKRTQHVFPTLLEIFFLMLLKSCYLVFPCASDISSKWMQKICSDKTVLSSAKIVFRRLGQTFWLWTLNDVSKPLIFPGKKY